MTKEEMKAEIQKCKENPHYFANKYLTVNGEPFQTMLNEKEFNQYFKRLFEYNKEEPRKTIILKQ